MLTPAIRRTLHCRAEHLTATIGVLVLELAHQGNPTKDRLALMAMGRQVEQERLMFLQAAHASLNDGERAALVAYMNAEPLSGGDAPALIVPGKG